jgi:hypothetical protein
MTPWEDYLAAAQRLDVVRRQAASMVANQTAAVKAARAELVTVRQRAAQQGARLTAIAAAEGLPPPDSAPGQAELLAASTSMAGPTGAPPGPLAVHGALRGAQPTLGATDAILSTLDGAGQGLAAAGRQPNVMRNLLVYLGFALATVLVPLVTLWVSRDSVLVIPTVGCAIVLPVMGYGFAWLTVGALESAPTRGRVYRAPVLGAATTVLTVVTIYLVYALLAVTGPL